MDFIQLDRLARSYVEHLLIALRADDRGANFRDFLDPWWAYKRGLVHPRRGGGYSAHSFNNPCPAAHNQRLRAFDWVSEQAMAVLEAGEVARIRERATHPPQYRLVVDHAIPIKQLKALMFEDPGLRTISKIEMFLDHNLKRAVLMKTEDQLLNVRLREKMPVNWQLGDDPFARYVEMGLKGMPLRPR